MDHMAFMEEGGVRRAAQSLDRLGDGIDHGAGPVGEQAPWHRALGQPGQLDWNMTYRPCVTIPATILIGVSFTPVGDHRLTASGRPGVRMKLPGLQASA